MGTIGHVAHGKSTAAWQEIWLSGCPRGIFSECGLEQLGSVHVWPKMRLAHCGVVNAIESHEKSALDSRMR